MNGRVNSTKCWQEEKLCGDCMKIIHPECNIFGLKMGVLKALGLDKMTR